MIFWVLGFGNTCCIVRPYPEKMEKKELNPISDLVNMEELARVLDST